MATFFERNKNKSILAALLLFLRERKMLSALLLVVILVSFLFIAPSKFIIKFPGGARAAALAAWVAERLGADVSQWGLAAGKRDFRDLLAAFRAAKNGDGAAGWAAFMRARTDGNAVGEGGSVDLVKGSRSDLESGSGKDGLKLGEAKTVSGVLSPEEAQERGEGDSVALAAGDLRGERSRWMRDVRSGALSGGAYAEKGFFNGKAGAIGPKTADVVAGGLSGAGQGQTARGVQIRAGATGRISALRSAAINARTAQGIAASRTLGGKKGFVQLATQNAHSKVSVAPDCSAGNGCPGEFASVNTGIVYDGGKIDGKSTDILVTPEVDGISTPNVPNVDIGAAEQMSADAKKCQDLDEQYREGELYWNQRTEEESDRFAAMGCGSGGCSKKKAKRCKAQGDKIKAACVQYMTLRCQHTRACPLTANVNCSAEHCNGTPGQKKYVSDVETDEMGSRRSETKD